MAELSKSMRRKARALIQVAYARELHQCLENLAEQFDVWRRGKMDCWDLNEVIHRFHDGALRDLYKLYCYPKNPIMLLSRAIAYGFLESSELPKEILDESEGMVDYFKRDKDVNE